MVLRPIRSERLPLQVELGLLLPRVAPDQPRHACQRVGVIGAPAARERTMQRQQLAHANVETAAAQPREEVERYCV